MSLGHGAKIVTDGLTFMYDAGNQKIHRKDTNLLAPWTWSLGTGSELYFSQNGDGNSRITATNPFGQQDTIWQTLNNDATSDADGGWNSSSVLVDISKMHRHSVWVKRDVLGNGHFYLGTQGYDISYANIGVHYRSNGTVTTNPYFEVNNGFTEWGNVGQWYLAVAHTWPEGSGTGAAHPDTGVYDTSGNKIYNGSIDFVWQTGVARTTHRSYLYYSTDPSTQQQWYAPRIDVCDGTEPSVQQLIRNVHNEKDLISNNRIDNYGGIKDVQNGIIKFNGIDTRAIMQDPGLPQYDWSIELITSYNDVTNSPIILCPYSYGVDQYIKYNADGSIRFQLTELADTNNRGYSPAYYATPGEKVHYLFVRTSTTVQIYVNGNLATDVNDSIVSAPWELTWCLGARHNSTFWYNGEIYLVKLYNKALTSNEAKQNFNAIKGRFGL